MKHRARRALFVFAVTACACNSQSPTAPNPGPGVPSPPFLFRFETISTLIGNNTVMFSWAGVGATDYRIEVGSASGANDVGLFTSPTTSFTWVGVPTRRTFYARVRAHNAAGPGGASNEIRITSVDLRDAIDALLFGSGSLIPADGSTNCVSGFQWVAFPPGATVRVRVSMGTVSLTGQEAVRQSIDQAVAATAGANMATFELTSDPDPRPGENEITVTTHPDPQSQGCSFERGCVFVRLRNNSFIVSARAVLGPPVANVNAVAAYPHDAVGHGFLGYCHIDGHAIGGARHSLMGGGPNVYSCSDPSDTCIATQVTSPDAAVARAVYLSGLRPGATRQDFIASGLIEPQFSATDRRSAPAPRRIRISATEEIVIIEDRRAPR